jgi:hypothetical protein
VVRSEQTDAAIESRESSVGVNHDEHDRHQCGSYDEHDDRSAQEQASGGAGIKS